MLGGLAAGAEPDAVVSSDVVEELEESDARLGCRSVEHVAGALIGGAEAVVLVEPVVLGLTRKGHDEMLASVDVDSERQLVA
jgi:hypothetical protein